MKEVMGSEKMGEEVEDTDFNDVMLLDESRKRWQRYQ